MPLVGGSQNLKARYGSVKVGGTCATNRPEFKQLVLLTGLCALVYGAGLSSVPVLDRDEARLAQATFQMIETGDYWRISFQDEVQTRQPHGIHWLQSAAVQVFSDPGAKEIWAYRLTSALAAWAAVLMTFFLARDLLGRSAAMMSALFLAATPVLIAEAHIATADAALLAAVVAAHWPLARAYLATHGGAPPGVWLAILFWFAVIASALIKGPVGPGVVAMTTLTLVVVDRRAGWLRALWPAPGLVASGVVLALWATNTGLANDQSFAAAIFNENFLPKIFFGQETHGAPPGTHVAIALFALGAALPFVAFGLVGAVRGYRDLPALRFCLAWLFPAWLVFELVVTKLPHYTLPLYPALALLGGYAVSAGLLERPAGRTILVLWGIVSTAIGVAIVSYLALPAWQPALPSTDIVALSFIYIFASVAVIALGWRKRPRDVALIAVTATAMLAVTSISIAVPRIEPFWITERIRTVLADRSGPEVGLLASVGYHEPSLVFRLGTRTVLTDHAEAVRRLAGEDGTAIAVDDRDRAYFDELAARRGVRRAPSRSVSGFNYSVGRWTTVWLYLP